MFWRRGNYEYNTVEGIVEHITGGMGYVAQGTWFVGVTANAVQSLNAHRIDTEDQQARNFVCWDIPFASAKACKEALLALEGYRFISDDESDFLDDTYPNSFIYLYQVREQHTVQHIDVSGFRPVKALPGRPVIVTEGSCDGRETVTRYGDDFDRAACAGLVEQIRRKFLAGQLRSLKIVHRSIAEMRFVFGEGCCVISYDAQTSQAGYVQSYRNGSRSRKQVPFFEGSYPEYMVCRDVDEFTAILQYFLEKDRKPGKRQNVKWVTVAEE